MSAAAAPALPSLPDTAQLSPLVLTILGQNPGLMTLQGTNTYVVGSGPSRILIDTGEGVKQWATNLRATLKQHGVTSLHAILLTHWHHDHTGGVADILDLLAPPAGAGSPDAASSGIFKARGAENFPRAVLARLPGGAQSIRTIEADHVFRTEGATLRALATPGHTEDHTSFVLTEERAVFTGDTILGSGTAVFSDLHAYLHSLRLIAVEQPSKLYPAHGSVIASEAPRRIEEYIAHRSQRESQILAAMTKHAEELAGVPEDQRSSRYLTAPDLVHRIYAGLDEHLMSAAANNVLLHLAKLEKDGRVASMPAPADKTEGRLPQHPQHAGHDQTAEEETAKEGCDDCQSEMARALAIAVKRSKWRWRLIK